MYVSLWTKEEVRVRDLKRRDAIHRKMKKSKCWETGFLGQVEEMEGGAEK